MKLSSFTKMIGSATAIATLSTTMLAGKVVAASSAKIAQYDSSDLYGGAMVELNIADLVRSKGEASVKPFEKLITKFSRTDKSNCDIATEVRLVSLCRSLEVSTADDSQSVEILDAVKSLYGIRMAVCETGIFGNQIPYPCNKLLPSSTFDVSHKKLAWSELELTRSGYIPACLRKLQTHHYLWTSYSNNRQDANDVVHLVRSEVEMRSTVMTYRDFEASMNGFREDFDQMRTETSTWYDEVSQKARNFSEKQDTAFSTFEQGFENISTGVLRGFDDITSKIETSYDAAKQLSSLTVDELPHMMKSISNIVDGITNIRSSLTDLYTGAAGEVVVTTRSQTSAIESSLETLAGKILAVQTGFRGLEVTLSVAADLSRHLNETHARSVSQSQQQQILTTELLNSQLAIKKAAAETFDFMQKTFAHTGDFSDWFVSLTKIFELFNQSKHIVFMACLYVATTLMLAPLETIIPHRIVFRIKTIFLAIQAGVFILNQLDLHGKVVIVQQFIKTMTGLIPSGTIVWVIIALTVVGVIVTWKVYVSSRRTSTRKADVEQASLKEFKKPGRELHMCDRQRQRYESISRSARHGTTPPGL